MSPWHITCRGTRYKVEHLPSGTTIASFASREAARDFVAAVSPLADWHKPTPAADSQVLEHVRRASLTDPSA
jgi:hypothetical protein